MPHLWLIQTGLVGTRLHSTPIPASLGLFAVLRQRSCFCTFFSTLHVHRCSCPCPAAKARIKDADSGRIVESDLMDSSGRWLGVI